MKKKAYTLAEILVAVGIVGVLAAIMIPLINKARPDTNKIMYISAYDSLVELVLGMANNENIYYSTRTINNVDYDLSKYPLLDYGAARGAQFSGGNFSGAQKLCNLIRDGFGATAVHACGTAGDFDASYNFTSKNGVRWKIEPRNNEDPLADSPAAVTFYNKVTIDVNGTKSPNADLSQTTEAPDRFIFYITADGKVTPADSYGQMYIDSRTKPFKGQSIDRASLLRDYPAQDENNIPHVSINISELTDALVENNDDGNDDD